MKRYTIMRTRILWDSIAVEAEDEESAIAATDGKEDSDWYHVDEELQDITIEDEKEL